VSSMNAHRYTEIPTDNIDIVGVFADFSDPEAQVELGLEGMSFEERQAQFQKIWTVAVTQFTDRQLQIFLMRYLFQMKGQEIARCLRAPGSEKIKQKKFTDPEKFKQLAEQYDVNKTYPVTQPYIAFVLRDLVKKVKLALANEVPKAVLCSPDSQTKS
jgi:leucyl-tRNA synthetase